MREWNTDVPNMMEALFWKQPADEIDAVIAQHHAEAPLDWFEEPDYDGILPTGDRKSVV